ncbi:hypothetical protein [Alteromonas sp. H39]|uniref:hypothetical protein n=1 Tax=Alteromonas sp. H39 TaxID=3389876 RepID=UPI0039DF47B8
MLIFGSTRETLPITVELDPTSGFPLLEEKDAILQYILAYLALPYSITDYGCGKKASLIIHQLLQLAIPPYAISRSLLLEPDLSVDALNNTDWQTRQHAMSVHNPLGESIDLSNPVLKQVMKEECPDVRFSDDAWTVNHYQLTAERRNSFTQTRSHVMCVISFWDQKRRQVRQLVLDPSLKKDGLFEVSLSRELVNCPEALLFSAPLLGYFRIDEAALTSKQTKAIASLGYESAELASHSLKEHHSLVRQLVRAPVDSIGDPDTWTFANTARLVEDNSPSDDAYFSRQRQATGEGECLREKVQALITAREHRRSDASACREALVRCADELNIRVHIARDAEWAAKKLQPLADLATQVVYFQSLETLAKKLASGNRTSESLHSTKGLQALRGLGVRLRRRIDQLAQASKAQDERIDARALNEHFHQATIATIKQMNKAGLTVFIDKVGNVHGLLLSERDREALSGGQQHIPDFTRESISHGSHIDTVNNAGKFDGRLGVLSGIEVAHTLYDLKRFYDRGEGYTETPRRVLVTAYIGEEMTFTGNSVSMPGSAAIASQSSVEDIHGMKNSQGQVFKQQLVKMLEALASAQNEQQIFLYNHLESNEPDALIDACSEPADFYTRHTYERHIEQGPVLDRANVPTALVDTIMGIHQEDFFITGKQAETAALLLNHQLRQLTARPDASDARITVGVTEGLGEDCCTENVYPALRWTLEGEMNHAGATPTPDRKDSGVAAGRLARYFLDWFAQCDIPSDIKDKLRPSISNLNLTPGTDRNVIPGSVSFTTALVCDSAHPRKMIGREVREDLTQTLEGYVIGTLGRRVSTGGEGIRLCRVQPVSYTNVYDRTRVTLDLRCDSARVTKACLDSIKDIVTSIEQECDVQIERRPQQDLPPFGLETSGQVLLMERSYGGSHNPKETEMLADILRGSILQFDATCQFLSDSNDGVAQLFSYVDSIIPDDWKQKQPRFTSGALHDTCNIAARAQCL